MNIQPQINWDFMADKVENNESLSADSTVENTIVTPDNLHSSTKITPDSLPDNNQTLPDSSLQNYNVVADSMPDNTPDDSQSVDNFARIPISEFLKKYGIGRDPLYSRMRYLQITTYKIKNKAYLDAEQAEQMDGLHEHIKATGRMEGYLIPEPSGPVAEKTQPTAVDENKVNQPSANAITVSSEQTLSVTENESIDVRQHEISQMNVLSEQIFNNAQNKAAGILIAENVLAEQFINNPEMLSDELKAKIQQSARIPEVDPLEYANALVNFAKPGVVAA
ncbi:hypothetical protein [Calothrix sp. CCY 0018]|uniref:hypothetical protein n=1 Tax=Calothrix sp. CCY 0018 TaxID=3103864 RepID=UPI0039C69181